MLRAPDPETRRDISELERHGHYCGLMARQIAFLRAINLANRRRVSMADLRELLTEAGYEDVRTHLQSGNVVLTSSLSASRLESELEKQLATKLGLEIQVLVRTRNQLADVIKRNPLAKVADNPSRYMVSFLSARPSAKVVRELARVDVAPEQIVVSGREIYAWYPNGFQRAKLGKVLSEQRLGVTATARNWNTVTKLLEIADE
jgi:uncharacterized protein (DUF1697 family)